MRLDISIKTSRDKAPEPEAAADPTVSEPAGPTFDLADARKALEKAWAEMNEPGIDASTRAARVSWVGGAIKIFCVITGEHPDVVQADLRGKGVPSVRPVPTVAAPDDIAAFATVTPATERTNRPRPPAQRPVALDRALDEEDIPAEFQEPPLGD